MNKLDPNIALIDQEANRLGITLQERGVNKRVLKLPAGFGIFSSESEYEFSTNGPVVKIRVSVWDEDNGKMELEGIENQSVETILDFFEKISMKRK
jgi:hypothetical protein